MDKMFGRNRAWRYLYIPVCTIIVIDFLFTFLGNWNYFAGISAEINERTPIWYWLMGRGCAAYILGNVLYLAFWYAALKYFPRGVRLAGFLTVVIAHGHAVADWFERMLSRMLCAQTHAYHSCSDEKYTLVQVLMCVVVILYAVFCAYFLQKYAKDRD